MKLTSTKWSLLRPFGAPRVLHNIDSTELSDFDVWGSMRRGDDDTH